MILASAAELAGSLDRKKVRDAVRQIKDFKGVTGTFNFDENGDPIDKDAVVLKYSDGEIIYVKTIKSAR